MNNLGDCYENGIQKDDATAVYWYQKAADLGNSDAMFTLGFCYENGQGIQKITQKLPTGIKKLPIWVTLMLCLILVLVTTMDKESKKITQKRYTGIKKLQIWEILVP
ncbi:hypothetical protein GEMRC1_000222 [Eukaryota sp. GEM-RC1]